MSWQTSVAVVSGAGGGIGRETALLLARAGCPTAAWDIDGDRLSGLEREAAEETLPLRAFRVDTAREDEVEAAVAAAVAQFGAIAFLFNNAGIQTYGSIFDTPAELWKKTLAVNLDGQFYTAKHCMLSMRARGGGAVVNTASVQAVQCQANVAAYTASKGAILALTRSMAVDGAPFGIRVNAICPGSVDTPMLRYAAGLASPDDPAGAIAQWGKSHLLGRVGTAAEVAELVAFLLMKATFMTGAAVTIDGGLTVKLA